MFILRKCLFDDKNRIRLDLASVKRQSQVLFSEKKTVYHGSVIGELFWKLGHKPPVDFTICPLCEKGEVDCSAKIWFKDKKAIEVYHKDGKMCSYPLREPRIPPLLKVMEKIGVIVES
jgi:hypothetical protein